MTIKEYAASIRISKEPTLLVEGNGDVRCFTLLLDSMRLAGKIGDRSLVIDHAGRIMSDFGEMGNKEKVEAVAQRVWELAPSSTFVGFVDREFQAFEENDVLCDTLNKHRCERKLVWSRGHSIENYFFEYSLMREPFRRFAGSAHFELALGYMEKMFEDVINIACALGLAARDLNLLSSARSIIDMTCLRKDGSELTVDLQVWAAYLTSKLSLDRQRIVELTEKFQHWHRVARLSEPEVVRWLCHGHIGMTVIWNAYAKFMFESIEEFKKKYDEADEEYTHEQSHRLRFQECAGELAEQSAAGKAIEAPVVCFQILDLTA